MSSVVKTVTPFILKDLLIEALAELNCLEQVQGERIITNKCHCQEIDKQYPHTVK